MARKILLADDSVTAQNMGRKILADAGYEVVTVNNGSAALKKITELKPDLVILDVYMPGYSGLEVCQRLKESQDTARIPVLLSVGKLEPFKPEEAQRVRADAFIVKPFEASELLSALSKLEDKVVPRSEPSKPSRFARAIAAAEESGRGSRNESETGWKDRIGFPKKKTAPEEKVADEAAIYNPMNRDLRTVVETPATGNEATGRPPEKVAEASVDAAEPRNLLNDVTPEEVAAIAAAVAQMQMAAAAAEDGNLQASAPQVPETKNQTSPDTPPMPVQDGAMPQVQGEAKSEIAGASGATAAEGATTAFTRQPKDEPVTMAATAESVIAGSEGGLRWTAVSVALGGEDNGVSLEEEMRKAYAAIKTVEAEHSPSLLEAVGDVPVAAVSIPEPEHVTITAFEEASPVSVAQSEPAAHLSTSASASGERVEDAVSVPVTATSGVEAPAENTPTAGFSELNQEPVPVAEFASRVAEEKVAAPEEHEMQPAPHAGSAVAESLAASMNANAPIIPSSEQEAEHKPESEVVASTAAAWASWRQTRDTSDARGSETAETSPKESEATQPEPAEIAAMAVAAGAEQLPRDVSPAASAENPTDVASIVDSVLAGLRPRLMEEISRKMAAEKK